MYAFKVIEAGKDCFGFDDVLSDNWDCFFEITNNFYSELFKGQELGKIIKFKDNAEPYLEEPKLAKTKKELYLEGMISVQEFDSDVKRKRKNAYLKEADALFYEYQRGEIDKQVWLDKVQEIKIRYPKAAEIEK